MSPGTKFALDIQCHAVLHVVLSGITFALDIQCHAVLHVMSRGTKFALDVQCHAVLHVMLSCIKFAFINNVTQFHLGDTVSFSQNDTIRMWAVA